MSKKKRYQIFRFNCSLPEVLQSLDVSFQTVHLSPNHLPRKKVIKLIQNVHLQSSTQLPLKVCGTQEQPDAVFARFILQNILQEDYARQIH